MSSFLNDFYQSLDPIAFSVGPLDVRWYGLAYIAGFFVMALVMYRTAKRWGISFNAEQLLTIVVGVAFGVIIGARLGYVLFYGAGYYAAHPLTILFFNEGGMSFHGGLIGAFVGGFIACKALGISFVTTADLAIIGAPIGLFFGRCANFVNGELWGKPCDLPWGVVFESGGEVMRHPSQLYEAVLEGIVIFLLLYALSRRLPARPRGTFIGLFLLLYGVFRFIIEFVRVPDVQLGYLFGSFVTMGQLLSLPLIVVGVVALIAASIKHVPQSLTP